MPVKRTTTSAPQRRPPTKRGLLPEARHLVLPKGITSTGFPAVRETCRRIGIEFDPWQCDLNKCLLAKGANELYAADTVVLSIPRQVGKTFDVGAVVFALCITTPGLTVVWTAHRFKVSRESFNQMQAWAKRPQLAQHIDEDEITTGAGNECIPFRNGSRIVFAARERGAVRGFTKVDVLVMDEAQILTEAALADLVPTANQAPNPLVVLMGTPPKPRDPGEVFTRLREDALKGASDDVLYVEFSAECGSDPDDRAAWRAANPSYPARTPARAILRMRKLLSAEDFLREALGIWDQAPGGLFTEAAFKACAIPIDEVDRNRLPVFFLDASPKLRSASITTGLAGAKPHAELADYRPGTHWLVERAAELKAKHPQAKWYAMAGRAIGAHIPDLKAVGIEPELFTIADMGRGCGYLHKLVASRGFTHSGDPLFTDALKGAVPRDIGEGLWLWAWRTSTSDLTTLYGITGALWALAQNPHYDPLANIW